MILDWSLLGPPLAAGLLIVATHVVLGREVLQRGIIFIDITIAQVAALGVVLAEVADMGDSAWAVEIAAVSTALAAAIILSWTESRWPKLQEALIGSMYVVTASLAVLLLAENPHGAELLNRLLAGQLLWVDWTAVWPLALLYTLVLTVWFAFGRGRGLLFYLLFAVTITASVQLVGIYLVFATLVLPALAVNQMPAGTALATGWLLGLSAYLAGLALSSLFDWPAGPLVVCLLAVLAIATVMGRRLARV